MPPVRTCLCSPALGGPPSTMDSTDGDSEVPTPGDGEDRRSSLSGAPQRMERPSTIAELRTECAILGPRYSRPPRQCSNPAWRRIPHHKALAAMALSSSQRIRPYTEVQPECATLDRAAQDGGQREQSRIIHRAPTTHPPKQRCCKTCSEHSTSERAALQAP